MEWVDDDTIIVDIEEECDVGTILLNIRSTDKDQGRNGQVFFRLEDLQDLTSLPHENKGKWYYKADNIFMKLNYMDFKI